MEANTQILIPTKNEENDVREDHFHVLAVDDSVIERKMLEKLLTFSSYHVTCVESGDKALEFLGLVNCQRTVISSDDDHNNHDHDDSDEHNNDNDDGGHGHDDDDDNSMNCYSLPIPLDNAHQEQEQGQGARVNLIMTDYSMPGMSGYDLLKRVKGSSWKDVPVVVMSSENVPSRIHMCLEEGAEEFLLKPVRLSDLKKLQPHILKPTSTTTTNTCHCCCETISDSSNLFSAKDIDENSFNEEITVADNRGDGKDEEKTKFKNEMEQFAKISKLDQLVM